MGTTTKTKVERLTTEQEAQLAPWRDQWLNHGLSTQPADRPRAEAGVAKAYREAGLEPPQIVIWLDSPLAGCIGAAMLARRRKPAKPGGHRPRPPGPRKRKRHNEKGPDDATPEPIRSGSRKGCFP